MSSKHNDRGKDSNYYSNICSHFEANKRSKEYVAHQAKVRISFSLPRGRSRDICKVHSVAWSCDGSRLASGSFDKTVTIWTLESDRLGREGNYKVRNNFFV